MSRTHFIRHRAKLFCKFVRDALRLQFSDRLRCVAAPICSPISRCSKLFYSASFKKQGHQTAFFTMKFSLRSIQPTVATLLLVSGVFTGCRRTATSNEQAYIDSVLARATEIMYLQPEQTDSMLQALQHNVKDSLEWYNIEVFRGTAHLTAGKPDEAARIFHKVQNWCRKNPNSAFVEGRLWNHKGVAASLQQNSVQSTLYFEKAFKLLQQTPRKTDLINISLNLADAYQLRGNLPKASEYYRYALFLSDSLNDPRSRTSTYTGLANVYMELENFSLAHRYYDRAFRQLSRESANTRIYYFVSRGNCYYFEKRYAEALTMFKLGLKEAERMNSLSNQKVCQGNLGEVYLMTDSLLQARYHLERCQQLFNQLGDTNSRIYYYLKSLQADLAIAEGNYNAARKLLNIDIDSLLSSSPRYLMLHYERLKHYAARNHQWQLAYDFEIKSRHYADSLRNSQIQNNVIEIDQRYQRDTTLLRQRLDLAEYETQNLQQRSLIYLIIVGTLLLTIASAALLLVVRHRAKQRLTRQMEKINELRMDIVRNRVSPHYIFNVLGTILPKLRRYPELLEPMDMLIDVLRGNLLSSGKIAVPLTDELQLVRQFVRLHRYSKGERPKIVWHTNESEAYNHFMIPSMSLQIPVENALKHAFPQLTDESLIDIVVNMTDNGLLLQVTDNGRGYNPANVPQTGRDTGTGLRLLTRTIHILNQYNPTQARFEIENMQTPQKGTRMTLFIPHGYRFSGPKQTALKN